MKARLFSTLVAVSLAFATLPARAQSAADIEAARTLFTQGSALANKGDLAGAEQKYARSLSLKRAPITLYSLGVVEKKLGHVAEALESFRGFLAMPTEGGTEAFVEPAKHAVAELDRRVARVKLTFSPRPQGVQARVDGVLVPDAALDLPRLVSAGAHQVTASAPGYLDAKARFEIGEGDRTEAKLVFVPAPEPAITPASPLAPVTQPAPNDALASPVTKPNRVIPIALVGGGAAVFVGGLVLGLVGVSQAHDAPTKDGPEAQLAKTKALVGDILGGVGIAAAAAGVVVLVTQKPSAAAALRSGKLVF